MPTGDSLYRRIILCLISKLWWLLFKLRFLETSRIRLLSEADSVSVVILSRISFGLEFGQVLVFQSHLPRLIVMSII